MSTPGRPGVDLGSGRPPANVDPGSTAGRSCRSVVNTRLGRPAVDPGRFDPDDLRSIPDRSWVDRGSTRGPRWAADSVSIPGRIRIDTDPSGSSPGRFRIECACGSTPDRPRVDPGSTPGRPKVHPASIRDRQRADPDRTRVVPWPTAGRAGTIRGRSVDPGSTVGRPLVDVGSGY